MPVPAENLALEIVRKLQAAGHTAYFAGGCVRDRLMNREPKDFDVATSAHPEQVLALFPRSQQVGVAFGVVLVREKRAGVFLQVEVATFRSDGTYTDGRHPDAVRFTTPQEDAQRRDFTCNGLFFDPLANGGGGALHDFVGGQADIQNKILRAIGDPAARFSEDHLRLMRAVRFAARLGFSIDPATRTALEQLVSNIRAISKERIGGELRLIFTHPSRVQGLILLQQSGLLRYIWPEALFYQPETARDWNALAAIPPAAEFAVVLVAVFRVIRYCEENFGDPANASAYLPLAAAARLLKESLVLSNQEEADFLWLSHHMTDTLGRANRGSDKRRFDFLPISTLKRLMADPRWSGLLMLHRMSILDSQAVAAENAVIQRCQNEGVAPAPFIRGETLIAMGAKPSPLFRQWIDGLYDRQLEGEFATQDQALAAARKLIEP